jgi:thioredoxin reductase (NADPH)
VVEDVIGNGMVQGVRVRNVKTGQEEVLDADGVFVYIGHFPNSKLFDGQLEMDDQGYVITDGHMRTSVEGVFAAGEIQDRVWRQVATSVGQGCAAAIQCNRWLEEHEDALQATQA